MGLGVYPVCTHARSQMPLTTNQQLVSCVANSMHARVHALAKLICIHKSYCTISQESSFPSKMWTTRHTVNGSLQVCAYTVSFKQTIARKLDSRRQTALNRHFEQTVESTTKSGLFLSYLWGTKARHKACENSAQAATHHTVVPMLAAMDINISVCMCACPSKECDGGARRNLHPPEEKG